MKKLFLALTLILTLTAFATAPLVHAGEASEQDPIVIFVGNHGRCHIRGKQFLYEGGVGIPLIVRRPGHIKPGSVSNELVSSLDICQSIVKEEWQVVLKA